MVMINLYFHVKLEKAANTLSQLPSDTAINQP